MAHFPRGIFKRQEEHIKLYKHISDPGPFLGNISINKKHENAAWGHPFWVASSVPLTKVVQDGL